MTRKKSMEEQIAFALRQAEAGTSVEEVCRKMGVSEPSFHLYGSPVASGFRGCLGRVGLRICIRRLGQRSAPEWLIRTQGPRPPDGPRWRGRDRSQARPATARPSAHPSIRSLAGLRGI
jgi:putative transposase